MQNFLESSNSLLSLGQIGIDRDYTGEIYKSIGSKPIKVVTGFRRAGKSMIVRNLCAKLIEKRKFKVEQILYLNFEDISLDQYLSGIELKKLIDYFLSHSNANKPRLLVLDEIQLVDNWSRLIRSIYEFSNVEIILTGSNSELLSSEIGSNLAGRFVEFHVQSFSFKEFLVLAGISPQAILKQPRKLNKLMNEYLQFGGLPEIYSINNPETKLSYLQGIISKVILDDVIERFSVRQPIIIEKILSYILINSGGLLSYTRIENQLKNLGIKIKLETVIEYISYLEKAFAINAIQKIDWKTRRVFANNRKYYAVDIGLIRLYSKLQENLPKILENLVYLKLKRENKSSQIFYGEDSGEIDFVILHRDSVDKYQVTTELNESNIERELSSLIGSDFYASHFNNYLLVYHGTNKDIVHKEPGKTILIKQRNLAEWLLN